MPRPVPRTRHSGSGQGNAPRKMLTDEDRKRMCRYHLDHPNTKQTEIGGKFMTQWFSLLGRDSSLTLVAALFGVERRYLELCILLPAACL